MVVEMPSEQYVFNLQNSIKHSVNDARKGKVLTITLFHPTQAQITSPSYFLVHQLLRVLFRLPTTRELKMVR